LILTLVKLQRGERGEALSMLRALGGQSDASVAHGVRAMIAETRFRCGELEAAVRGARAALAGASVPYRRVAHCTLARTQLALADYRGAVDTCEAALLLDAAATPEYELDLLATHVSALRALGQHESAARVLSRARAVLDGLAAGISDASLRQTFLTAIESHVRIATLARDL
jgi:tetratricopeptide (TPR) repeat protein